MSNAFVLRAAQDSNRTLGSIGTSGTHLFARLPSTHLNRIDQFTKAFVFGASL